MLPCKPYQLLTFYLEVGTVNNDLCKDEPVEGKVVMATSVLGLLGVITNTAVGLRLYTRIKLARGIGYDDYLIIAASLVLGYVQISGTIEVIAFGLGKHTFNVDPKFHLPNLYLYWSDEMAYQITITLVKSSILCFYVSPQGCMEPKQYVMHLLTFPAEIIPWRSISWCLLCDDWHDSRDRSRILGRHNIPMQTNP
ncbi:MAG: hypothetical protein CL912_18890 [Deltaproteobacteria bacterium]|nr:hypothetical protein [Deltaproteobacteria bacterium]